MEWLFLLAALLSLVQTFSAVLTGRGKPKVAALSMTAVGYAVSGALLLSVCLLVAAGRRA